jgi:hypothetical protein
MVITSITVMVITAMMTVYRARADGSRLCGGNSQTIMPHVASAVRVRLGCVVIYIIYRSTPVIWLLATATTHRVTGTIRYGKGTLTEADSSTCVAIRARGRLDWRCCTLRELSEALRVMRIFCPATVL